MLTSVLIVCLFATVLTGIRIVSALQRYRYTTVSFDSLEPPTVSVCIAARNERNALTQSLERILASNYERQEILVLDDASEDDTSLVINSFAHAGVRFIPGRELPEGLAWTKSCLPDISARSQWRYSAVSRCRHLD